MIRRPSPSAQRAAPLATVIALLAACTAPPTAPPTAPTIGTPPTADAPRPIAARADTNVARFERQQIDRAGQAMRTGDLAEAALAWEVLTLLRPDQDNYRSRLAEARSSIDKAVTQRSAVALAAQRRNDTAGAERAWLEVLAVQPTHATAAQALRAIERDRNRASVVGRFTPLPGQRSAGSSAMTAAPRDRAADRPTPTTGQKNHLEHASMLAGQGELDAAIALLDEALIGAPQDLTVRLMLSDMLMRRADGRADRQHAAAVSDLKRALQLDPRSAAARAKLQRLERQSR